MLLLIALVLEVESHRGEIYKKKKSIIKKEQLLRAPSVGRRKSTRVDEGRKGLLAIKIQGTNHIGEGEESSMRPRI